MVEPFHTASRNFTYTADDLMEFFSGKDIGTPVSYTHLDVYKRQGGKRLRHSRHH